MWIWNKMRPKLHSSGLSFLFYDQAKTLHSEALQFVWVCVCVLAGLPWKEILFDSLYLTWKNVGQGSLDFLVVFASPAGPSGRSPAEIVGSNPTGGHRCLSVVSIVCCLCDELITRPEESYRQWCVVVCDLDTSWMRRPWPTGRGGGCGSKNKHTNAIK